MWVWPKNDVIERSPRVIHPTAPPICLLPNTHYRLRIVTTFAEAAIRSCTVLNILLTLYIPYCCRHWLLHCPVDSQLHLSYSRRYRRWQHIVCLGYLVLGTATAVCQLLLDSLDPRSQGSLASLIYYLTFRLPDSCWFTVLLQVRSASKALSSSCREQLRPRLSWTNCPCATLPQ